MRRKTSKTVAASRQQNPDWIWWRDGVIYQIYPRSFADSNADGIGDLQGIIGRLEYLEWLGIDGLWINPTYPSPNEDGGFDVAGYCDVHPELGTLADLDELIAEAGQLGIRVMLDLIPNHTSDQHPWFQRALSSPTNGHRDLYVWRDPRPDGSPPNNWKSLFGGTAWTLDETSGQYYLHNFLPSMPDLDWWNPRVWDAVDDVLRFWFNRGIAGFRIDVAHGIVKDRDLRDNPPAGPDDIAEWRRLGQRPEFSLNRPEVHEVHRHWRRLADQYEGSRALVGETWVSGLDELASFYGNGTDELHLAFNFVFLLERFAPARLAQIVARTEAALPEGAWPAWTLSNHDLSRFPTRWAGEDPRCVGCLLMLLMTLRGTPILYYGDELGMRDTEVPPERRRDRIAEHVPDYPQRDRARTPMPWSARSGAGFTRSWVQPWLPFGDIASINVTAQREDTNSPLHLCRDLIALRRANADLRTGRYAQINTPEGVWAYRRGDQALIALNLSRRPVSLWAIHGQIMISNNRARDGETVLGNLELTMWEGAIVALGQRPHDDQPGPG